MFSEIFCVITGTVQRVGYRDFAVRLANEYGVVGYVKNRKDGSVELLAQGIPDDLKALVEALNAGSPLAEVDSVAVDWRTPDETFEDFQVLF